MLDNNKTAILEGVFGWVDERPNFRKIEVSSLDDWTKLYKKISKSYKITIDLHIKGVKNGRKKEQE